MEKIIEQLEEIKSKLAQIDKFEEAKIVKNLISRLKGDDAINISNNDGQINITSGNSSINATQEINNKFKW